MNAEPIQDRLSDRVGRVLGVSMFAPVFIVLIMRHSDDGMVSGVLAVFLWLMGWAAAHVWPRIG